LHQGGERKKDKEEKNKRHYKIKLVELKKNNEVFNINKCKFFYMDREPTLPLHAAFDPCEIQIIQTKLL